MKHLPSSLPFNLTLTASALVMLAMFSIAMLAGAADVTAREVWLALTTLETGDKLTVIREIRLPREVAALLVGSALAVAGAIMQGVTRNPLADPGLLGLTAGANTALAVTLAFAPSVGSLGIMTACFLGAAAAVLLVFGLGAVKRGGFSPLRIVLAGAAVSAFLYALTDGIGLLFRISKDISMWTAGGLVGTTWTHLFTILPFIVGAMLGAMLLARQLTVLSLSEQVAASLGQSVIRIKALLFLSVLILAGASVALVGNLAFIGLIVPHLARRLAGTDYRRILPMSALLGASLMLLADTLGRTLNAPYETPVAAIAAVMGIPFFLLILRKGGRSSA
ncbi:iron ABC transporter permease [Paenibacillus sp. YYML68]|uniref:FecCD family ABC transporter permease n=1 Tax=Paenibacillus sp. YYML68 TaxID=2909250 RepID=UPI00248F7CAB|nr:iron ABC transporter permease [Paenibacillus sp. YYML68]